MWFTLLPNYLLTAVIDNSIKRKQGSRKEIWHHCKYYIMVTGQPVVVLFLDIFFTWSVTMLFLSMMYSPLKDLGAILSMQLMFYLLLWKKFLWKAEFDQSQNDNGSRRHTKTKKKTSRIVTAPPSRSLVRYVTFCPELIKTYFYMNHVFRNVL